MMKSVPCLSFTFVLLFALPCWSDEHQKAEKLLNQLTAMATDPAGKRAVSRAVSDSVSVGRPELAQRRHAMNINYGELFLVYELVRSGAKMDDIAAQMKSGKTLWQIASERRVNWKQIAVDAKKLNSRVDNNLLGHFANRTADAAREQADSYDPFLDSISADRKVTQQEIEDAQRRYMFLRDHAGVTGGVALDTSTEKAVRTARPDPVRSGGPANPDSTTRPGPRN